MAKKCILSALLLQLLYTSVEGNSPCPDFKYIKLGSETIGQITIRNPPKNNFELHLKVDLKVTTLTPYKGRIDLTKSKMDAARDVLEGRSLVYHIHFPVQNPLPTVHRIWFNHDEICSGPEVSGSIITTIKLEHTLKIIIQSPQNQPNSQPTSRPAPPAPVDEIENYNDCGITSISGSLNLLVAHGNETLPGQWPWVAAIFQLIHYKFVCGGNLLTTKHVLTAGHCLIDPKTSKNISANMLSVALGRHKLMNFIEPESVTVNVARYNFHPEYRHTTTADSDLAILILSYPVEFTAFIKPICLPPPVDPHRLEQKEIGIVVGWGEDEHGNPYTEEPRLAIMPLVKRDECLLSHQSFYNLVSLRTFCAGGQNLTVSGICNGDSGSGLVVFDSATGRYQLRGVVSRKPLGPQLFCDGTYFIVFVDVLEYLPWIKGILERSSNLIEVDNVGRNSRR